MRNSLTPKAEQGIGLMCGAMLLLPLLDCIAKILGEGGISSGQIVLFRFVMQVLLLLPVLVVTKQLKFNFDYFTTIEISVIKSSIRSVLGIKTLIIFDHWDFIVNQFY